MKGPEASAAPRSVLALLAALAITAPSHAQDTRTRSSSALEEIIVTATRVETDLQQTPMSIKAFSGEALDLAGIDTGRELGIMVPNVVINPGPMGEFGTSTFVRGLPGVTTYIDGINFFNVGFLQRSFVEIERVEVLRGPQGTLFGRNTNGGAVQIVTRRPAEEFGARLDLEAGEFDQRTAALAVDVPLSETLKTKWTGARDQNDGFVESLSAPFALGHFNNSLLRADFLWEPANRFALRFNLNEENRESSPARIVRITNAQRPPDIAYNVLAGNPDYLAQARAVNPSFPNPPFALGTDRYTPETHTAGFPGGTLGPWQTRTTTRGPTTIDQQWAALTIEWDITDELSVESLTAYLESDVSMITDSDVSELDWITVLDRAIQEQLSQELHLTGNHFEGRLRSFLGLYYQQFEVWQRFSSWNFWEFAIPNTGPNPGTLGPPGAGGRPLWNQLAVDYVRAWGATAGNAAAATFSPNTHLTADRLFRLADTDRAFFGQLAIGLAPKLDLTLGFRFTQDDGSSGEYLPADAFRPLEPGAVPLGDPYAVATVIGETDRADFGTVSTPRVAIAYRPTEDVFLYASYAEGFTSSEIINNPRLPEPYTLSPEVVATQELGLRSTWANGRLRFNATLFDSSWDGFRVFKQIVDPSNPAGPPIGILSSDGVAAATGLEVELFYSSGERWQLDFALGLLHSEYRDIGDPAANGTGLQPGIPFAYAPDTSYSLGARYRWPLGRGAELLFAGNYGWMDEYQRASENQFQSKNPDGSDKPEPAYGVLNARIVYQPRSRNWQLSLFGTNLTNEWYVNGGFDNRTQTGFDSAQIGRPREVGLGLRLVFE
jgi:iron complex outermembrane receptor protein